MSDAEILIFKSWPHPVYDHFGQRPDGTYSQLAWLPTIGPTSWLLWNIVASQLRAATDDITWDCDDLARALGIAPANRHGRAVPRVVKRLRCYRLIDRHGSILRVRTTAPPVGRGALERLPADIQVLHARIFGDRHRLD